MINNPTITLCVLAYNRPKDLENTIRSFLWQAYKNSEMVIIDDKSPQDLRKVVSKWSKKDKRIRYIRNKKNLGFAKNFYQSFAHCRGKYVIYLGDDDVLINKNVFEEYLQVFKNDKVGVVRSRQVIFVDGKVYQAAGLGTGSETNFYKNTLETFNNLLLSTTSISGLAFLNNSKLNSIVFSQETVYPQVDLVARMSLFYASVQINKYLIGVGRGSNQLNPLIYDLSGKESNMMDDVSSIYDGISKLAKRNKKKIMSKNLFMKKTASFVPIFLPYNTLIYGKKSTVNFITKIFKYDNSILFNPLLVASFLFLALPRSIISLVLILINKIKLSMSISGKDADSINKILSSLLSI